MSPGDAPHHPGGRGHAAGVYIIADIAEITDPASFQDYAGKAGPTIPKYDGKPRVVRGKVDSSRSTIRST